MTLMEMGNGSLVERNRRIRHESASDDQRDASPLLLLWDASLDWRPAS